MNLVLVGLPGSGKTSLGQELARRLGRAFIDTDERIEVETGMTIPRLFQNGEQAFRQIESAVLARALDASEAVVATGGGMVLDAGNRGRLIGERTLWLDAPDPVLLSRCQGGDRPLLQGDARSRLGQLRAERSPLYQAVAEGQLRTEDDADAVMEQLVGWASLERLAAAALWGPGARRYYSLGTCGPSPAALVTSESVLACAGALEPPPPCLLTVPDGEAAKRLGVVEGLYRRALAQGLERRSWVVAYGGGTVTDTGGFFAATFLRGLSWLAVPTTLVGQADAALGGKVGVDLPEGKNLVGAFHAPSWVYLDPIPLATLPPSAVREGMAEVIKTAILGDGDLFHAIERSRPPEAPLGDWARRCAAIKLAIVAHDPTETGRRAVLNLGHTVGHAIEQVTAYGVSHGQAVSLGLVAEAEVARRVLGVDVTGRIERVLSAWGLPIRHPGLDAGALVAAMRRDKKREGARHRLVLPAGIGVEPELAVVEESAIEAALARLAQPD